MEGVAHYLYTFYCVLKGTPNGMKNKNFSANNLQLSRILDNLINWFISTFLRTL